MKMRGKFLLIIVISGFFSLENVSAQRNPDQNYPDKIQNGKLAGAIVTESLFYLGGMSFLQYIWYKDSKRVPFEFYNDNTGYLQVDKAGHVFGSYLESYIGYYWLRNAGVSKKAALWYGGTLGIILQTPIEVFDGIYEGWGFSWGDIAANAAGSGLLIGQEILFDEQIVINKFSFSRSKYATQANGYLGTTLMENIFNDYNGHTYWLSFNANRLFLKKYLPDWFNIALGYGANGMFGEFTNKRFYHGVSIPETQRYRQYLLSLDIDWTKIKTRSRILNLILKGMTLVKLPFPALELNSKGQMKGYAIYF